MDSVSASATPQNRSNPCGSTEVGPLAPPPLLPLPRRHRNIAAAPDTARNSSSAQSWRFNANTQIDRKRHRKKATKTKQTAKKISNHVNQSPSRAPSGSGLPKSK